MSIDEIGKPGQLTNQFVRQLHENQGDRTGYFQIVQFHQKRQKYYSTHISDGYYKCKVIFREKPSKQIQKGQIKLFSIIQGTVSNQGNRILMIFTEVRAWDYSKTIGVIRSWKFQNRNLYINGSSSIEWTQNNQSSGNEIKNVSSDNENEDTEYNENGGLNKQLANKVQQVTIEDTHNYQNTPTFSFGSSINIFQNNLANENSTRSILEPTQSITHKQQNNKSLKKSKSELNHIKEKDKILLIVEDSQTQSQINSALKNNKYVTDIKSKIKMEQISERISEVYSKKQNSTYNKNSNTNFKPNDNQLKESSHKNRKNIWNFCLRTQNEADDDFDDDQQLFKEAKQLRQKNYQMLKESSNFQLSQKQEAQSKSRKQKSIFQLLYQQQEDQIQQQQTSHKQMKSNQKPNGTPKECVANLKTPFKVSHSKKEPSHSDSDFELAIQKSHQKTRSLFSLSNQVSIRELIINFGEDQNCKNWVCVQVLCMRFLSEGKMLVILQNVKENEEKCIFNMILSSADIYCPFEEGFLYQLSLMGVSISEPNVRQFKIDLEFLANSQDITARKIQQPKTQEKSQQFIRHPYYVEIEKISELKQGTSINVVGLISRCRNFYNKKKGSGWTNIFTIIDPFSGSSIEYTIFDASKLSYDPGSPIILYNTLIKYYQAKITLITRCYTLCYIGKEEAYEKFCQFIPQLQQIRAWEEKGNKINKIVGKTQNFRLLYNLLQIQSSSEQNEPSCLNVQTPVCRVIKISPFFLRIICDQCHKKMNNVISCLKCGRRQNPLKQVHLSIQISDYSHTCYVQFNEYDSIGYIGEEGERLRQFSESVMHRRVKLWLALNPKYKSMVIKMETMEENEQSIGKQMEQLKEMLKYI